jgi:hypothetical protein
MKLRLLLPVILSVTCAACITHIRPDVNQNPPPSEALSAFQHYQLMPVTGSTAKVRQQTAAMAKISANVSDKLGNTIEGWQNHNSSGRTLKIQPRITQLKFVSGTKRVFAGDFAGSSAVIMKLRLTDVETGRLIAEPEFFQRAAAEGGTWTFGGTDNAMLVRIATVAQQYLQRNYTRAVGGPTGLDGSEK